MFKSQLDIFDPPHNNAESQQHYENNRDHFLSQRKQIKALLLKGDEFSRLKGISMGMLDPVKRIWEIRKVELWEVSEKWNGKTKNWFCTPDQIEVNKKLK